MTPTGPRTNRQIRATEVRVLDAGDGRTRFRLVGLGYGTDEESKKLRAFFEKGNAFTLKKMQEHFQKKN